MGHFEIFTRMKGLKNLITTTVLNILKTMKYAKKCIFKILKKGNY